MKEYIPQEEFEAYVSAIGDGEIQYERKARELADRHGLNVKPLEEILPSGSRIRFDMAVRYAEGGEFAFVREARTLCNRYGFPREELEIAVEAGKPYSAPDLWKTDLI